MKIAFLDRDGVINVNTGYLHRIDDFQFVSGCMEALKVLQQLGYHIAIITNQSGIARGYYKEEDYHDLTNWMLEQLEQNGVNILQVNYCPHLPNGTVDKYAKVCDCRKPNPGMIHQIVADQTQKVDLAECILVGDNLSDVQAGGAAGISHLFLVGENHNPVMAEQLDCQTFPNLHAVTQFLMSSGVR